MLITMASDYPIGTIVHDRFCVVGPPIEVAEWRLTHAVGSIVVNTRTGTVIKLTDHPIRIEIVATDTFAESIGIGPGTILPITDDVLVAPVEAVEIAENVNG
ncbi:hypothetical protein HGA91_03755 [candidate division WWE3 bacterium]|nr:hypothetical protein [candidate division WWE3 bacterium]